VTARHRRRAVEQRRQGRQQSVGEAASQREGEQHAAGQHHKPGLQAHQEALAAVDRRGHQLDTEDGAVVKLHRRPDGQQWCEQERERPPWEIRRKVSEMEVAAAGRLWPHRHRLAPGLDGAERPSRDDLSEQGAVEWFAHHQPAVLARRGGAHRCGELERCAAIAPTVKPRRIAPGRNLRCDAGVAGKPRRFQAVPDTSLPAVRLGLPAQPIKDLDALDMVERKEVVEAAELLDVGRRARWCDKRRHRVAIAFKFAQLLVEQVACRRKIRIEALLLDHPGGAKQEEKVDSPNQQGGRED
jgi:hypothetical protein